MARFVYKYGTGFVSEGKEGSKQCVMAAERAEQCFVVCRFNGAFAFNGDVSGWDVSSVTNMYQM